MTLALLVTLVSLHILFNLNAAQRPTDGWFTDRGAFGRYEPPLFLDPGVTVTSDLQPGDRLVAVNGIPFDVLEGRAAAFDPLVPEGWEIGGTVQYTVLRDGRAVEVTVHLGESVLFGTYGGGAFFTDPVLLSFPLVFLIALVIFGLRPRELPAQLLLIYAAAYFLDDLVTWVVVPPGVSDLLYVDSYWPRILLGNLSWNYLILPVLLHFFLVFPVKQNIIRRFPHLPHLIYFLGALSAAAYVLLSVRGVRIPGDIYASATATPVILIGIGIQVRSLFIVSDPVARLQARWVVLGSLLGLVAPLSFWVIAGGLTPNTPFWQDLLFLLLVLALPVSYGIAILRYRLWDIEVIIRRTLVYSLLSGALGLIYLAAVVILQNAFVLFTEEESELALVISTLGIAGLFQPLRSRIQRLIDRSFYRRKYDAERTLARLTGALRDEVDQDRLVWAVIRAIRRTIQPTSVSVWIVRTPEGDG